MSRQQLADAVGAVYNTIRYLEDGRHDPTLGLMLALVRVFDLCSVEELLGSELGTRSLLGEPHHRPVAASVLAVRPIV
jgi:DNA-binding XRE family transcriptional regulator